VQSPVATRAGTRQYGGHEAGGTDDAAEADCQAEAGHQAKA